jgi:RimJ/RimL family protein N-acetyltransferase
MCAEDSVPVVLQTARLKLEPLVAAHAQEMAPLLADERLYTFTGGRPPTLGELRVRYARQVKGRSADGVERWFNWILRRRSGDVAVGFLQATVSEDPGPATAELAWVVGVDFQGCGYAREGAEAAVRWLEKAGVQRFVAYIHPSHRASMGVAQALGMASTDERVDGEVVWERRSG